MQSFPWKNIIFLFCPEMEVESGWLQAGWLEAHDLPAATAHLSPAEVHSRAGSLPAKWHRREKETINTQGHHLFTDVHWQERNKETRLSFQGPGRACPHYPRALLLLPARPTSPFLLLSSCKPSLHLTLAFQLAAHSLPPTPWLLPPLSSHPVRWYMPAAQRLGQIPGLVKAGEKPNIRSSGLLGLSPEHIKAKLVLIFLSLGQCC